MGSVAMSDSTQLRWKRVIDDNDDDDDEDDAAAVGSRRMRLQAVRGSVSGKNNRSDEWF